MWRGPQSGGDVALSKAGAAVALALTAAAFASILLLGASPRAFAAVSAEDGAVEALSAGALFLGSLALLGAAFMRGPTLRRTLALGLGVLLFLTAMEEISWMQRVVGFQTPEELASVNMQGEFNFHNLHTDYFENLYYLGSFALLVLLPLLAFAMPWLRTLRGVSDFVPSLWVAAAAAPAAILNYGMWNVVPMQASMMMTALAMLVFALAARRRGARGEAAAFGAILVTVVAGQALLLAQGHRMEQIFDASEYKELFIALGLACFAVDVLARARRGL
jgi:hypothetical protein